MTQDRGRVTRSCWSRSSGLTSTGPNPRRHVNSRTPVRVAALAACLIAAATVPVLGDVESADPSAPPSKRVIGAVRVVKGLNLGDACERYYPLSSRAAREEGTTTLVINVDADGLVKDTVIEVSSGYIALDEATELCFMDQGRFVAQTVDGTPVSSWQRLKFTWSLPNSASLPSDKSIETVLVRGGYAAPTMSLLPDAKAGSIDAEIMVARMYLQGIGVTANAAEGAEWMRRAATQGSTIAAYESGVLSDEGIGGPKDYSVAAYWFRKAAHRRHADAAFRLALKYQSGLGVERDAAMALLWIDAAIRFLAPSIAKAVRPGYASTRESIVAGMSLEQVEAASRITTPDGPVIHAELLNRKAIQKAADAAYPADLGEHSGRRTVVLLVRVLADGHVAQTQVETSSGLPGLDAVTAQVLSQAEIRPKTVGGHSVDAWQIVKWDWALH